MSVERLKAVLSDTGPNGEPGRPRPIIAAYLEMLFESDDLRARVEELKAALDQARHDLHALEPVLCGVGGAPDGGPTDTEMAAAVIRRTQAEQRIKAVLKRRAACEAPQPFTRCSACDAPADLLDGVCLACFGSTGPGKR